jgi:tetratricopeptide (TPR) repeat protein/tRNA A-37 threonylcarbamoyl transferase component Bud32
VFNMTNRVEELFHNVADLSTEARVQYFHNHSIDENARREIEELLTFDSPAHTGFATDVAHAAWRALDQFEPVDKHCGPYRLERVIGRGGMGSVYSAQRIDGEVSRRVAIKILQPQADDETLRRRFLAERQILAGVSHPNISTLLDAGHRDDGQPYLVMEYIDGRDIDAYAASLGIRDKIRLFLKVCAAVSYLHRNLIVHRDLKPANILVTADAEPKILDFGIAKLLEVGSTLTNTGMLTPDYASPEQVTGDPVTTATDVYSLGAVLYKLLTGSTPHQLHRDSPGAVALSIARGTISSPSKLQPTLRGDLEMILMKALRKEPQERYSSVEQFSEDLENYLEHRPIRARRGDVWYRTRRSLRRHWLYALASTLTLGGLAAGALVANYQRHVAQERFLQVRELANKLFDIDAEVRRLPGSTKARKLIVGTSINYLERVSTNSANIDPEFALELGTAYMRVARVQGIPIGVNLGRMDEAAKNLDKADRLIRTVLNSQPANRTALLRSGQIAHDRMLLARLGSRRDEALAFARTSAESLRRFHPQPGDKAESASILNVYLNVADQYDIERRYDDALHLCQEGGSLAQALDNLPYRGSFLWVSGDVSRQRGDIDGAVNQFREASRILEPKGNADQSRIMNYILALIYEARMLGELDSINLGRTAEAVDIFDRAFHLADTYVHQDLQDQNSRGRLTMAGLGMADILRDTDPRRSLEIYDHVLRHLAEIGDNQSFRLFESSALIGSIYPLQHLGRRIEARKRLDGAFERLRNQRLFPADSIRPGSESDLALCALGDLETAEGNIQAAIKTYTQLLGAVEAWHPQPKEQLGDAVDLTRIYRALGRAYRRNGEPARASEFDGADLALWRHWDAKLPHNAFVLRYLRGTAGQVGSGGSVASGRSSQLVSGIQ